MPLTNETLESGALLPVLPRATHQELRDIVNALNKGWDVFITWDTRYNNIRDDLTQNPGFVAEYLLRAGSHSVVDWFRGSPRSYTEIVNDVCHGVHIEVPKADPGVVELEALLLRARLDKLLKGMTAKDRELLEQKMRETAGPDVSLAEILTGGAKLASLLPMVFAATADIAMTQGLVGVGTIVAGRAALSWLGPIGLVLGATWMAYDLAGPSLRATVPAVTCVALLRQRMIWNSAQ
jgi:uncharacterized protein YaaW (UPF0174 family)